jgi:protein-S-isoprenylcysteine O-methyltransferase Ste14
MNLMTGRIWLDSGRLIMVPWAAGFLLFDGFALVRGGGGGEGGALQWLTTALVCAFYALIIWCYLRRGPAIATGHSVTAHAAAVVAMVTPFVFPLLRAAPPGAVQQWAGDVLLAAGTGWAVWSLRALGRSVSVIAQARKLVVGGPYRWVRHPLYTGEIVSSLGLALTAGSLVALAVWLGFCVLQGYRALREEQLLVRALPGYRGYQARTAALLPGLSSPVTGGAEPPGRRWRGSRAGRRRAETGRS